MQAAGVAAENQRMRGRKPKAPQYYEFDAALNVRPPFFKLANEARLQECGSLLAEPAWPDGYAQLPRHPWRLPDYRESPLLVFDKRFGRPARDVENFGGLWFVTSAMKAFLERVDPDACDFRKCDTEWTSGEAGPEYWLCSVTRLLFGWDVIDVDQSRNLRVLRDADDMPPWSYSVRFHDLYLKPEAIGSARVFRIIGLGHCIFCDQSVKDAYKAAGLKGAAFDKLAVAKNAGEPGT
jgi:hypothetical protein